MPASVAAVTSYSTPRAVAWSANSMSAIWAFGSVEVSGTAEPSSAPGHDRGAQVVTVEVRPRLGADVVALQFVLGAGQLAGGALGNHRRPVRQVVDQVAD
ncbi:hypothetical protein ACOBQX_29920 [Actinokineospora sp. G85]|uniref:hypothetical protein n=1 Tax=Actinokineospora sp. G85 TaxID=3406626 RepID=UPI003C72967B